MASSQTNEDNLPLPVIVNHRYPNFSFSFNQWLQNRFRLLEPDDQEFPTLSLSVRLLLCVGPTRINSETFAQYPSLECVVGSSSGLDHIDLEECRRRGVKVTNAGEAFTEDVADFAVGLLIDVLRRVSAADRFVRAGFWPVKGDYPLGSKLGGKRIGIVGLGSIGSEIAKRLQPFGCIISYNSRNQKPHVSFPFYANVHDLAINSDALIVCCALTNETRHFINKDVMTALGKKGVIINVGRGDLIDERELVQCLMRGEIGGAGLDVFEKEPKVPEELLSLENVVLSPHKAVATPESIEALRNVVIGNIDAFFSNKPLLSQINLE